MKNREKLKKKNSSKAYIKPWTRWHRRIGMFFVIPAILLSITGILLNHADRLKLDDLYVTNSAVLNWYGMEPIDVAESISIGGNVITLLEDVLYINGKRIAGDASTPTGGGELDQMIIVSTTDEVLLLEAETYNLIEKLDQASLPSGEIIASSVQGDRYLLDTTEGTFSSSHEIYNFTQDQRPLLSKATFVPTSEKVASMVLQDWRGRGLSLWRIVLDIHSGKFFGAIGVFLADVFAVVLLLLVASGLYLWRKRPAL